MLLWRQIINRTARQKEAWLTKRLTDPVEATVLLDDKHRLVVANQAALSMLGISERNIDKFTMETFVSCRESGFGWVGQSSMKKANEWRICRIRRLDGSSMTRTLTDIQSGAGGVIYECGSAEVFMYPTPNAGTFKASQAFWQVNDVEAEVAELKERGLKFEEYNMPGVTMKNSIATAGGAKTAWFKDTEGNILAISQNLSGE